MSSHWHPFFLGILLLVFLLFRPPACCAKDDSQKVDGSWAYDSHSLADALARAVSEASDAIHNVDRHEKETRKERRHQWILKAKQLLHLTPPSSDHQPDSSTEQKHSNEMNVPNQQHLNHDQFNKRRIRAFESFRFYNKIDMEETIAGARLLSGSFRLISTTAGFVADTVRISGDTAAGIVGSSVKIMGVAVKSVGSGLSSASRLIDNSNASMNISNDKHKVPIASEHYKMRDTHKLSQKLSDLGMHTSWRQKQKNRYAKIKTRSRKTVAKSVNLLGAFLGGVGETLLIGGVAAESVASATAGLAEETVRLLEDLAGTVSVAISLRGHKSNLVETNGSSSTTASTFRSLKRKFAPSYLSFHTYEQDEKTVYKDESRQDLFEKTRLRFLVKPSIDDAIEMMHMLAADAIQFGSDVSADVEGVPSMASELGASLLLCYMIAYLFLAGIIRANPVSKTSVQQVANREDARGKDVELEKVPQNLKAKCNPRLLFGVCRSGIHAAWFCTVKIPFKVIRWCASLMRGMLLNRTTILLSIYFFVWTYLSQLSKQRALLIQRRAEAIGFRNGIASFAGTSIRYETANWLNYILQGVWRVRDRTPKAHLQAMDYPIFVTRSMHGNQLMAYGGLEPYISSLVGTGIVKSLDLTKALRPTDVAYVSLFSLSLGTRPPIIRGVNIGKEIEKKKKKDESRLELDVDLDGLFEDMSLVLEVKLSSLTYALLPSTKIKIHNIDFRASIKAILVLGPRYPFISKVELSMVNQPYCDLRVTPISKESGLKGIDLGSLPFLNDWIREAIRVGLSDYVSPKYVTIDVAELLQSDSKDFGLRTIHPSLDNLRQRTRATISNPRTSTPDGIAITSVADKLESHQSSIQVGGVSSSSSYYASEDERKRVVSGKKSILKPVTELSRLALDRHGLRESNLVRPVTEIARLGMDHWLDTNTKQQHQEAQAMIFAP